MHGHSECPFCGRTSDSEVVPLESARPGDVVAVWEECYGLVPLNPRVEGGHVLVIPYAHVEDFACGPAEAGAVAVRAAELVRDLRWDANLIVSKGAAATRTVRHLHMHALRRTQGDDVSLPWDVRLGLPPAGVREELEDAARRVRARADAAPRPPWFVTGSPRLGEVPVFAGDGDPFASVRDWPGGLHDDTGDIVANAAHITLWDPAVAVAVASALEGIARSPGLPETWDRARAVARALTENDTRRMA